MEHSFNVYIAEKYGVHAAILLNNLEHWIAHNKANNTNYRDGYYWTFNSKRAFAELFPYMNERQIDYALKKLIDDGIIITSKYNTSAYNHTLWYTITKLGYSILQNCEIEETKLCNGLTENVKSMTNINNKYINTDINERNINYVNKESESLDDNVTLQCNGDVTKCNAKIDIYETPQGGTQNLRGGAVQTAGGAVQGTPISMITNSNSRKKSAAADIEEFFERVWKLYPKKTNKTQIRKATKERLYKIGYEKIARCIERYKQELEYNHTEYQFIKAGSTFFNGGYEDYLADDWQLPPKRTTGQRHDYMPNRTPEEQAALEAKLAEYKFD